jgi:aminopeptidase N
MSSYLLSVAVGRFEALSASAAQVPLRILVAEGRREQAHEALRATRQVLPWYADYFGQPYALPKLDQLAVPGVRSGAMEDWGLVSYAEDLLLFDPARSDSQTQREVYQTVAHELAHQWFGNLVTAASWDELWLNEAFATWLQDKATDRFNPAWQIPLRARPLLDRAMALDSGAASRAIRAAPVRESAVNDVFDEITYAKGGALLGMIEQWLGPATLRQGLVAYMQAQRLSSATAADLWHHIGQAAAQAGATVDVAAMAASWTDQAGFPLVEASSRCVDGQARLSLRQSRFSLGLPGAAALPEALWQVPVQIEQGGKRRTVLLDQAEQGVELGACSDTPTLVNAGGLGFYRVAHDAPTQQALIRRYAGLTGADRVALLSDSEALLQAGRQDLPAHLALLDAVARIDDASQPLLWAQLRRQLEDIDTLLGEHPARALWRALGRRLAEPALARLGWSAAAGEAADLTELRSTLITLLVRFEHGPSISQALRAFDADASGRRRLPPALREPVLRAAGMWGERAQVELLRARLNASDNEEDRWLYARALAGGRDPARAAELLLASLGDLAPPHVASELPGLIARNSPFGAAAYDFTLAHWAELARRSDDWGRVGLLPAAAAGFCEPAQAERLLADQRRLAGADGDSAAQRQAAAIRLRAAVRERVAAALMPTPVASPVVSPAASPASR